MSDIIFFPMLRWLGMRLDPDRWHPNGEEGLLGCHISEIEITAIAAPQDYAEIMASVQKESAKRLLAYDDELLIRQRKVSVQVTENAKRLRQTLAKAGWRWNLREAAFGYVAIKEIEKQEGRPPLGSF